MRSRTSTGFIRAPTTGRFGSGTRRAQLCEGNSLGHMAEVDFWPLMISIFTPRSRTRPSGYGINKPGNVSRILQGDTDWVHAQICDGGYDIWLLWNHWDFPPKSGTVQIWNLAEIQAGIQVHLDDWELP